MNYHLMTARQENIVGKKYGKILEIPDTEICMKSLYTSVEKCCTHLIF